LDNNILIHYIIYNRLKFYFDGLFISVLESLDSWVGVCIQYTRALAPKTFSIPDQYRMNAKKI